MEEGPLLLDELEQLLTAARDSVVVINSQDPNAAALIAAQLRDVGMALVSVSDDSAQAIAVETGSRMAETFGSLSLPTKAKLGKGDFIAFSDEWHTKNYDVTCVAGKSNGMANAPPLDPGLRDKFALKVLLKTVHVPNTVNATNNVRMWELLCQANPELHPSRWFTDKPADYRVQVSEDGVKIFQPGTKKRTYEPTALHYDGQLGHSTDADARRIQIIYAADKGSVRLFAVPGTHLPRVREIIQRITGVGGQPGFITLKDKFAKQPKLAEMLLRFGVTLPTTGLIMFRANVWHYEGNSGAQQPGGALRVQPINDLRAKTAISSIFRIYCGVVSVPPEHVHTKLVPLAFMRENGWCMDPYTKSNRDEELFVNQKSTQAWKVTQTPTAAQTAEFKRLAATDLNDMKAYLSRLPEQRLALYGLHPNDVADPRNDNNAATQSPSKRQRIIE